MRKSNGIKIFGPITRVWSVLDHEKELNPSEETLVELSCLFEQVMLLIAQTHNTIVYHRRENVLTTLIDSSSRVKDILKNQSKDLNEASNKYLFGEEFESFNNLVSNSSPNKYLFHT